MLTMNAAGLRVRRAARSCMWGLAAVLFAVGIGIFLLGLWFSEVIPKRARR